VEPLWLSREAKENKPKIPGSLPCPVLQIIVTSNSAGIYWMVEP
jgi:hypothetical protein